MRYQIRGVDDGSRASRAAHRVLISIASGNPNIPGSLRRGVFHPGFAAGGGKLSFNLKLKLAVIQHVISDCNNHVHLRDIPNRAIFAVVVPAVGGRKGGWRRLHKQPTKDP